MNQTQARKLQRVTCSITRSAQYIGRTGWLNGPVVFSAEPVSGNTIMLSASNNTKERCWFETSCFALVFIGPRGGIRVTRREGFPKHVFQ